MKKTLLMLFCGAFIIGMTMIACNKDDEETKTDDQQEQIDQEENNNEENEGEENEGEENQGEENEGEENGGEENGGGESDLPASLQGSDYYVIVMDDYSFESISDKVTLDIRPSTGYGSEADGYHGEELWFWAGYTGGTCSGLNFYGEAEEWVSMVVTDGDGWSGFGFCLYIDEEDGALEHNINNDEFYLHLAYKTSQSGSSHCIYLVGPDGTEGTRYAIGETDYNDNGTVYNLIEPDSGTFETGEWNEYNIPVSKFDIDWSKDYTYNADGGTNILCGLSGGTAGVTLDLDAVFIYKK